MIACDTIPYSQKVCKEETLANLSQYDFGDNKV